MNTKDDVVSKKKAARCSIAMRRVSKEQLPTSKREQIKLAQLYITAEKPIPVELHPILSDACKSWITERPSKQSKDEKIYDIIYNIHFWSLLNKKNGSKAPIKGAVETAINLYNQPDAYDIYKAVGKSYNARKELAQEAKRDAEEDFNNQNWD